MNIPQDLKYTKNHEWIRVQGDSATIGITEFAQNELGDIVFVEIEVLGETIDKEESFGTIEAVKTVADVFMPVTGEITEVNEKLADAPDLVNKSPYDEGWLIKIKVKDSSDIDELMTPEQYNDLINA